MYLIIKKKVYVICINVYVLRPKCHLGRWFLHTVLKYRRQQVWQCVNKNRPVDFLRWKLHQIFIGHKEPVGQKRSKAVESYLEEYPPGNGYISHLGKRKIIFKSTFSRGYVSSLEGIPLKMKVVGSHGGIEIQKKLYWIWNQMTLPKPPVTPFEWNPEIPNTRSSPTQQDNQDFMKCQTCDLQWGMDEVASKKQGSWYGQWRYHY